MLAVARLPPNNKRREGWNSFDGVAFNCSAAAGRRTGSFDMGISPASEWLCLANLKFAQVHAAA
jgi:hypothetical protein